MKPSRKEENGSCGRQKVDSELQVSFAIVRCMLYRTDLRGNQNTSTSSTDIILFAPFFNFFHFVQKNEKNKINGIPIAEFSIIPFQ